MQNDRRANSTPKTIRIALAQSTLARKVGENLAKNLRLMESASRKGAQMIVFPELCLSPFFPRLSGQDVSRYAMSVNDRFVREFQSACKRLKLAASPNIYLREGDRYFDASLMINVNGEIMGVSKMVHIGQFPGFYERDYYTPSDTGFRVYELTFGRVGIVVCFDRHFPESIRTSVLRGAEVVIIPTANITSEPRDLFECEIRSAAFQNGVYVAMCNRVGKEGEAEFCGESVVIDSNGRVIAKAGQFEELLIVEVDPSRIEESRSSRPYLSLRRPDSYE